MPIARLNLIGLSMFGGPALPGICTPSWFHLRCMQSLPRFALEKVGVTTRLCIHLEGSITLGSKHTHTSRGERLAYHSMPMMARTQPEGKDLKFTKDTKKNLDPADIMQAIGAYPHGLYIIISTPYYPPSSSSSSSSNLDPANCMQTIGAYPHFPFLVLSSSLLPFSLP